MIRQMFRKVMDIFTSPKKVQFEDLFASAVDRENSDVLLKGLRQPARVSHRTVGKRGKMRLYRSYPSRVVEL
jgi:hypothetical protein